MKCNSYQDLLAGYLDGNLGIGEKEALEEHLAGCPACRDELAAMQVFWERLGRITAPVPSAALSYRLRAMLDTYRETVQLRRYWWPLAYSAAAMLTGLFFGYLFFNRPDTPDRQLAKEVRELKETMLLTLIESPSASDRMKAVSYTGGEAKADNRVVEALLETLNNDENTNVRLRALDALSAMSQSAEVREGLILSITKQDSPVLQSAIADLMLKLQEKKAVHPFQRLLQQKEMDPEIREKIKKVVTQLI